MPNSRRSHISSSGLARVTGKAHVLIVEDNAPLRGLMADVLTCMGCKVTEAFDASSMHWQMHTRGQEVYPDEPFDLIITDVQMPGETGLVLLEKLRRKGCPIPAVVVTAFPELATREQVHKLDATLLPKPFSLNDFRAIAIGALCPGNRVIYGA
jgi:CheY-like chemotaxis protein